MSNLQALLIAVVAVSSIVLCIAIWRTRLLTAVHRSDERLYPVPVAKFMALSFATMGLYVVYWQYRCWKQVRFADGSDILPFWRALFGVLWSKRLFDRANDDAQLPLPEWVGVAGAIGYFLFSVGLGVSDHTFPAGQDYTTLLSGMGGLFIVPSVVAVNRSNTPEIRQRSQRISTFDWGAGLVSFITLIIIVALD